MYDALRKQVFGRIELTRQKQGRPQFHPVMLLKVLVFAYSGHT